MDHINRPQEIKYFAQLSDFPATLWNTAGRVKETLTALKCKLVTLHSCNLTGGI